MEEAVRISPLPPELKSQDFTFLREAGLEKIRQIASQTWTDHNVHDPGITMLEAFCYAMTEAGLRTGMPMQDLLASASAMAPQEFFSPRMVLPSSPVTALDFRKVLLDHHLIQNAWVQPLTSRPAGKYSVLLEFEDDELNNFTFPFDVTPPALLETFQVSVALPHWDEPEVQPLLEDVDLTSAAFDGTPWQVVEGSDSFFARVLLDYQPSGGPAAQTTIWVVANILTPEEDLPADLTPILDEISTVVLTLGDNSDTDLTLLKQYNRRVAAAHIATEGVRRYLSAYRNIGESFPEFRSVRIQEVAIDAGIEITAGVDAEQLLATIFFEIDQFIAPRVTFDPLESPNDQTDAEVVFDGPALNNGFLDDETLIDQRDGDLLYTSDLLRIIYQQRGAGDVDLQMQEVQEERSIVAVHHLALANYLDNRIITSDARDCLQLVNSSRHVALLSPEKCDVTFLRNGVDVDYDMARVLALFDEMKVSIEQAQAPGVLDYPLPAGERFGIAEYYPVQNDLPVTYGVGQAGLSPNATTERQAQASQLKGYMFFFEQILAGHLSQLGSINAFFSADPSLASTTFQQPLYHLPEVENILRDFDTAADDWEVFQADANNAYARTLADATETEDQYLDRRNRTLDHLIARLGEDLREMSGITFRRAHDIPNAASLTILELLAAQNESRRQALRQLIQDKSAFYYDLPALNRDRPQAFGNVAWRLDEIVQITVENDAYHWRILDEAGQPRLQHLNLLDTEALARREAEDVLVLGTSGANYFVVPAGVGQFRFEIRSAEDQPALAESVETFASNLQVQAAMVQSHAAIRQMWVSHALMPLECRLIHLLQTRFKERRQLVRPRVEHFEIFDEVDADALIEKRFRLWELVGASGDELLASETNYPGPNDAAATADAEAAIGVVIDQGVLVDNYVLDGVEPAIQVVLNDPTGNPLARTPGTFVTMDEAQEEIVRIQQLLAARYGLEGFYVLEHHLLAPVVGSASNLELPDATSDPYSFQVTIAFPSGYARNFVTDELIEDQPARFRDEEFRRYAARVIRKACPAHILPHILWVDKALDGATLTGSEPAFDTLESRYRAWLEGWFTNGIATAVLASLREDLVATLNAIYQDVQV